MDRTLRRPGLTPQAFTEQALACAARRLRASASVFDDVESGGMKLAEDVAELLNALGGGVQERLGHNLVGVYLRGSLALGGFRPETSDVDVLAVTERPVNEAEFAALATLHTQLAALPNPYAERIEMAYIDRAALRRFQPGVRHPTLGQGDTFKWNEHQANWILERWTVRECGVTMLGPVPQTLIDPVSSGELCQAVRARLGDWAAWARTPDDPEWLAPRSHKAYVVETMCRALYTLAHAELSSKQRAVAWALEVLAEPWRSTVARSQTWRTDRALDPGIVPEVRDFILWTASCPTIAAQQVVRPAGPHA